MRRITLDFETYYSKEFSLKNMPTMQYIRDPRFCVEGMALQLHGAAPRWIPAPAVASVLAALPWGEIEVVCHNAQFDGAILAERYGVYPKRYFCTMFAAQYLISQGELDSELWPSLANCADIVGMEKGDLTKCQTEAELAAYACQDAAITTRLYEEFAPALPEVEQDIIDLHVRMAAEPRLDLDVEKLTRLARQDEALEAHFDKLRNETTFAAMLNALGVNPEYKVTNKGNAKLAIAKTDSFMQKLLVHSDVRVRKLALARQKAGSTIERTRSQRFIDVGAPLPVPLMYYGAHTGRSSGLDKLNMQNLKRDGEQRSCLRAPEGHSIVTVDSSQIEVRVLAWLAREEWLLDTFRQGRDPYSVFASRYLYPQDYDDLRAKVKAGDATAKTQRQVAKAAVLALGFGQGAGGFLAYCERSGVPMDAATAERTVQIYRDAHPNVRRLWKSAEQEVKISGCQVLPSKRKLVYPKLRIGADGLEYQRCAVFRKTKSEGFVNLWHGLLTENLVQAAARDVVFSQALMLARKGWKIVNLVHDQVDMIVPDEQVEAAAADAQVAFGVTPKYMPKLPLACEVSTSKVYGK